MKKNKFNYKEYKDAIVTIDDVSTLDIDDAVAVKKDAIGNFHVYVAIANVSKFLEEHPEIKAEAYKKATSVYKLGDMEPMIPNKYSEDLISLVPHVERDVVVGYIVVSKAGNVLDFKFFEDTMVSNGAVPYQTINGYVSAKKKDQNIKLLDYITEKDEYCLSLDINVNPQLIQDNAEAIQDSIDNSLELASIIRTKRKNQGAILINEVTAKYELDEDGEIVKIMPHLRKDSEIMIEELMILANTAAANQLLKDGNLQFVRSHYKVNEQNIEAAAEFLFDETGHKVAHSEILADFPSYSDKDRNYFNKVLLKFSDRAYYKVVKDNEEGEEILEGHQGIYGVGSTGNNPIFDYVDNIYTHFTSPIRRYTDVVVHELLRSNHIEVTESMTSHFNKRKDEARDAEKYSVQVKVKNWFDKFHNESVWSGEIVHTFGDPGREFAGIVKLNNGQTVFASNPRQYYRTEINGVEYQSTQRKFKKGSRITIVKVPNERLWKLKREKDPKTRMEFVQAVKMK